MKLSAELYEEIYEMAVEEIAALEGRGWASAERSLDIYLEKDSDYLDRFYKELI